MNIEVSKKPSAAFSLGKYITKFCFRLLVFFIINHLYWAFKICGLVLEEEIVMRSRIFRSVNFVKRVWFYNIQKLVNIETSNINKLQNQSVLTTFIGQNIRIYLF